MFASFPKRYYKRDEALVTSLSVLLASGIAEKGLWTKLRNYSSKCYDDGSHDHNKNSSNKDIDDDDDNYH